MYGRIVGGGGGIGTAIGIGIGGGGGGGGGAGPAGGGGAVPVATGTLPFTGLYTGMLLVLALTLLIAGVALLRVVQLRRAGRSS